jgi:Co/Zn/Cd efflux system component
MTHPDDRLPIDDRPPADVPKPLPPLVRRLEQLTGVVLGVVLAALAWILVVSEVPDRLRLASEQTEVILVVGVLTVALGLVSLVALLHTRSRE